MFCHHLSFFSLLLVSLIVGCSSQSSPKKTTEPATFILVRHAEKADDGTDNPPLNDAGEQRARRLAAMLSETNLTAVYSTDWIRTRQTVQAVAEDHELSLKLYDAFNSQLADSLCQAEKGGTVLVSGHSNTIPQLMNQFLGTDTYQQLPDDDYDNMELVHACGPTPARIMHLRY